MSHPYLIFSAFAGCFVGAIMIAFWMMVRKMDNDARFLLESERRDDAAENEH